MAERIVSPAVFTNEIDQTFLTQGISQIGGAVVGPFSKGPAFSPTVVRTQADLEDLFGQPDGKYYQPFTAREYLKHQGVVTIVRVGSLGGYEQENALTLVLEVTNADSSSYEDGDTELLGVLANTLPQGLNGAPGDPTYAGFAGSTITGGGQSDAAQTGELDIDSPTATLNLSVDDEEQNWDFHLNPSHPDSLHNIFGRAPQKNVKDAYFHCYFENTQKRIWDAMATGGAKVKVSVSTDQAELNFQTDEDPANPGQRVYRIHDQWSCREAETPVIQSQKISGQRYDLFSVKTRNMGSASHREIKIGIYNVRTPGTLFGTDYGTFSLVVRRFSDTDKNQEVLENYDNLTLDPDSSQYLPRVIGDRHVTLGTEGTKSGKVIEHGEYANKSNWIRIVMPVDAHAPANAMPYGFKPYFSPVGEYAAPQPKWSGNHQYHRNPGRYFAGTIFIQESPDGILYQPETAKDQIELLAPIPHDATAAGDGFYLDEDGEYWESIDNVVGCSLVHGANDPIGGGTDDDDQETDLGACVAYAVDTSPSRSDEIATTKLRRFMVGFQGGFDGHSPTHPINLGEHITATNVQGLDCSRRFSPGTVGYLAAFAALSNQDEFDLNLLVTPGLALDDHRTVINRGVDLCETREDCFYILDTVGVADQPGDVDGAVEQVSTLDSNYAAAYYPWVKVIDPSTNKVMPFPPSAVMPAVFAQNDKVSAEWFAPAGLNRGGIEKAVGVLDRLNFAERDILYEGKVNPIAAFPGQGIVAFGQKTLQRRPSALDRINVRRLLIALKKFIASTSRFLIFEQNVAATRNRFLSIVNPYLESVQQRHGLFAYRVIMDETNNTPDLIDRNILYGQIFLQPARAVEFVILDFNLTPTGASFEG